MGTRFFWFPPWPTAHGLSVDCSEWGIFDLLIGFRQDTLFAWGTGYIKAGRGMGNVSSLAGSEQPRLVKVGGGTLQ